MAAVELRELNRDNFNPCVKLKPKEEQTNFVASNAYSIAQCKVEPNLLPLVIYANDEPVGFTLIDTQPYKDDGCHWILRLMIDDRFQGQGYGKAAMEQIIERMTAMPGTRAIRISFVPDNATAKSLYLKMGFADTGETVSGEVVLERKL